MDTKDLQEKEKTNISQTVEGEEETSSLEQPDKVDLPGDVTSKEDHIDKKFDTTEESVESFDTQSTNSEDPLSDDVSLSDEDSFSAGSLDTENNDNDQSHTEKTDEQKKAEAIIRLDTLIKGYLKDIDKMRERLKTSKDMLSSAVENDAAYQEINNKVKELNKKKTEIKQKMLNQASTIQLKEEVMSMSDEMKESQQALSDYLREYQRLTEATEFETDEGEVLQILHSVRLARKSSR